jgi:hypothetical protein
MTMFCGRVELTQAAPALTLEARFQGRPRGGGGTMSRIVPAAAAGLILSQAVAVFGWWWAFYLFPPSPLYDLNPALARAHPGGLPFAALFWQALAQGLGALLGGLWARRLAREEQAAVWAVAAGSWLLAIVGTLLHPRPVWFAALSVLLIGAGAWAAARLATNGAWRAA